MSDFHGLIADGKL